MLVFTVFIFLRSVLNRQLFLKIGQNTLSIYVIHFIILYGSFTGFGLYKFYHHRLTPNEAIPGALLFMMVSTALALVYDRYESVLKKSLQKILAFLKAQIIRMF